MDLEWLEWKFLYYHGTQGYAFLLVRWWFDITSLVPVCYFEIGESVSLEEFLRKKAAEEVSKFQSTILDQFPAEYATQQELTHATLRVV